MALFLLAAGFLYSLPASEEQMTDLQQAKEDALILAQIILDTFTSEVTSIE